VTCQGRIEDEVHYDAGSLPESPTSKDSHQPRHRNRREGRIVGKRIRPVDDSEDRAWGTIRGNLLQARGGYYGTTWIFDVERAEIVAGPFRRLEETSRIWTIKHAPGPDEPARAVALGEWHGRGVVAVGHLRQAEVFDLENGDRIDEDRQLRHRRGGLGRVRGRALLATGSDGGTVTLWEGPR
jgi:hypothetical protein